MEIGGRCRGCWKGILLSFCLFQRSHALVSPCKFQWVSLMTRYPKLKMWCYYSLVRPILILVSSSACQMLRVVHQLIQSLARGLLKGSGAGDAAAPATPCSIRRPSTPAMHHLSALISCHPCPSPGFSPTARLRSHLQLQAHPPKASLAALFLPHQTPVLLQAVPAHRQHQRVFMVLCGAYLLFFFMSSCMGFFHLISWTSYSFSKIFNLAP